MTGERTTTWASCRPCGAVTRHDDGVCYRDPRHHRRTPERAVFHHMSPESDRRHLEGVAFWEPLPEVADGFACAVCSMAASSQQYAVAYPAGEVPPLAGSRLYLCDVHAAALADADPRPVVPVPRGSRR